MNVYFSLAFKRTVDEIIGKYYCNLHTRQDFLDFFYLFECYQRYDNNEYVHFQMSSLRLRFGRFKQTWKLPKMVKLLKDVNILEYKEYSNNPIKPKTRGYSYTNYFTQKVLDNEIEFSQEEISDKIYYSLVKSNKPEEKHLLEQYKILKGDRFEIDHLASINFLKEMLNNDKNINKFFINQRNTLSLYNKDNIYTTDDEKTGRVFTNFVNIKRELRKYCIIDGEHLLSLDLKTAQPLFLAHMLKKYYNEPEIDKFYEIVTQDDIYDYLYEKSDFGQQEELLVELDSRVISKERFMIWLFSDGRGQTNYGSLIKKVLPKVWDAVQIQKRKYKSKGSNLAIELQRTEAKIFIGETKDLIKEGCLTVHDSIYFKESLLTKVRTIIENALDKYNFRDFTLKLDGDSPIIK